MRRLVVLAAAVIGSTVAGPALANAPSTERVPIDASFTARQLSATCGFSVIRHVTGSLTIRTFVDGNGRFVRELDQYNLVETVSANGNTLTGRTTQNIVVKLLGDGSYTVATSGTDFRLPVKGAGVAFGTAGRLVLHFDADNNLIDVQHDVGNTADNQAAICAALAPN